MEKASQIAANSGNYEFNILTNKIIDELINLVPKDKIKKSEEADSKSISLFNITKTRKLDFPYPLCCGYSEKGIAESIFERIEDISWYTNGKFFSVEFEEEDVPIGNSVYYTFYKKPLNIRFTASYNSVKGYNEMSISFKCL